MSYQKPFASDQPLRAAIRELYLTDEQQVVDSLLEAPPQTPEQTRAIEQQARLLVERLRNGQRRSSLIAEFLQEFTLSSDEGIVLMCLAEALLRIPDSETADELIRDKLTSADWGAHLGRSESLMVNASSWGMLLTGKWISMDDAARGEPFALLRRMIARSGEPAIRLALRQAMKILGREFVLAESIDRALQRAQKQQTKGFTYSFDMLGEAARTERDAGFYTQSYRDAIKALAAVAGGDDPVQNSGISVKLSALHPRYEFARVAQVEETLYARLKMLALHAREAGLGFNIDAEEADRLELSLSLFEKLAGEPALAGWGGLGFVVQAYQKRAPAVIDWLNDLAQRSAHRFMVRLVKGAYWDTEIKRAQQAGLPDYPVYTRKENTDLSYLVCARKLLSNPKAFYAQFATHNALTVAAVMHYAEDQGVGPEEFEFQCLHGMGEDLYESVLGDAVYHCRIYAPVGEHAHLLAYLVRRLLENGANTSFVNLLAKKDQDIESLVADPLARVHAHSQHRHEQIVLPAAIYLPERVNSAGVNIDDSDWLDRYYAFVEDRRGDAWEAQPLSVSGVAKVEGSVQIVNPACPDRIVGRVGESSDQQIDAALDRAKSAFCSWDQLGGQARAEILEKAAELYQASSFELMTLCQLEAGKTLADAIAEVREAIDFLRYYAVQARKKFSSAQQMAGPTGEDNEYRLCGRGVFVCISPWNFPLAIFTGQVAAALAAGNAVIAKPAEQTPLIAYRAVEMLHRAGVPREVLHYLPGGGGSVGARLTSDPRVDGVAFTGGTDTARRIHASLAARKAAPLPLLIAETGGLNVMIVDSSALAEQVVADVIDSAFQSAGQRCSALRVLYIQEDVADSLIEMISGAMQLLRTGDPLLLETDVGPIIDRPALEALEAHLEKFSDQLLMRAPAAMGKGYYFPPAMVEIEGVGVLQKEVFGPILHVAKYRAKDIDQVVDAINASGYGLTLGIHCRIHSNVQRICRRARVGNIYVNRNMIGAVVGVQPFGGEGLSGTGPKAGGPHYLHRFAVERVVSTDTTAAGGNASLLMLEP